MHIKLKKVRGGKPREKFDLERLKEEGKKTELENTFMSKWDRGTNEESANEIWKRMRQTLKESAKEVLGMKKFKRIRKEWVTKAMLGKMEERRKWKTVRTEEGKRMYRKLNNELRRETEQARKTWLKERCNEIEELEKEGKYEMMYRLAADLVYEPKKSRTSTEIERSDGTIVHKLEEVLGRWKEYVECLYEADQKPNNIELEEETRVAEEDKGCYILEVEVEKALREMKNHKASGIDGLPVELLKSLGSSGVKELTYLCNTIYEKGEWPDDFLSAVMIPLEKKRNAKKCEDFRTISLISHAAKVLLRVINRRLRGRLEESIAEEQFGFRRGKGTRDAIGLLRVIGERYIERGRQLYTVFVDLEKAFDRVQWNKLMNILKKNGVDWRDRRLIKNLYLQQRIRVQIGDEMTEESIMGRGVRQGCCLSPILFNIYLEHIMQKCMKQNRGVRVGGRRIECIRFADDMVLLAENERTMINMLKDLNKTCEEFGMRINKKKTKCMVISARRVGTTIRLGQEVIEQVSAFKYLGSIITEDMRCHKEVKTRIAMAKEAFNKKRRLLCGSMDRNLRKRLAKCFIWSVALYGAETWTLRKEDERRLEAFEMWIWRRMEGIKWVDKVRNEEVLRRVGEEREILKTIRKRKRNWLGHWMRRDCLLIDVMEGTVNGRRGRGRRRYQMVDSIRIGNSYEKTKRGANDRTAWRAACEDLP